MPRFSRARAPRRRTEWYGKADVAFDPVGSGGSADVVLFDMANRADSAGVARFTDPTLVRIRGNIGVDGAFASNQGTASKNIVAHVIIYFSHSGSTLLNIGDQENTSSPKFSSDDILWTGMKGMSSEWTDFGTPSSGNARVGAVYPHLNWEVDIKAMRKCGDRSQLRMAVVNYAGSGSQLLAAAGAYYYALRCLFKE